MDVLRRNRVGVVGNPDGRTVVLAHGFGCDQNMWRLTVPALVRDHRVVLFDYVGSGPVSYTHLTLPTILLV